MRATYCKKKNTYTTEQCRCNCRDIWKQGVGSLVGQGINEYNNTNSNRSFGMQAETDASGKTETKVKKGK
jgi:hypothetical protein